MAKTRRPFIVRFFKWIFGTVLTLAILVAGFCAFLKIKYDISVTSTIKQMKILNEPINESEVYTNKFADSDKDAAMLKMNANIPNFITYSETDGYKISSSATANAGEFLILLSDKQIGALVQIVLDNQEQKPTITVGDKQIELELVQIAFSNINENGDADVNIVVKFDISFLKEQMTSFPTKYLAKYIPSTLYVSSTVRVAKDSSSSFKYDISSTELTINKLDKTQTSSFLKTISHVVNFGTSDELNLMIGKPFVDALIGNETANGLTYSLKPLGITDYSFSIIASEKYYVITKR